MFLFAFCMVSCYGQIKEDENLIARLMTTQPDKFKNFLLQPELYEVQIIYTQVNRDANNRPILKEFSYQLNPKNYFNPASLVKLPIALLALEKLNQMNVKGVDKYTRMGTGANYTCQTPITGNNPQENAYPCVARYIEKMLLVSDNDAYTRLYEFLGQAYIHQKLKEKGYADVQIIRRFTDCDSVQNRYTNPITFFDQNLKPIHYQNSQYNTLPHPFPLGVVKKELNYQDAQGRKTSSWIDNTYENFISLKVIQEMLMSVLMPESVLSHQLFQLTEDDVFFLKRCLGAYPNEGKLTKYSFQNGYFDAYKKYLFYGRKGNRLPYLRSFNIVGWWAGYLADVAYFLDKRHQIEFYLSAVVFTHNGKVFDYERIGFPFLENLGKLIYQYELTRERAFPADVSNYKIYE